jgi:hypothetical protein
MYCLVVGFAPATIGGGEQLTSKLSRAAFAAAVTCGASALVAIPAQAADTQYFVNSPLVLPATAMTPESATLGGVIDTGGNPGATLSLPAGGTLSWSPGVNILNTSTSTESFSVDGLPVSGADSNVMVSGGSPAVVPNAGDDNYSDVEFAYDPLVDYTASGNLPGPLTQTSTDVNVPTTTGLSTVSENVGAFGTTAQNNTGNTPLNSNTTYVYWLIDQAGADDDAQTVDLFNPSAPGASTAVNPNYQCLPNAYISQNAYLKTLTSTTTVSGGLATKGGAAQTTPQPAFQGSCVYLYGDANGKDFYESPTGEFKTPALGKLSISGSAVVTATTAAHKIVKVIKATDKITDKSAYKASGSIELDDSDGDTLATANFAMQPGKTEVVKLKLTKFGIRAVKKHQSGALTLTSNWDQQSVTKKIKL